MNLDVRCSLRPQYDNACDLKEPVRVRSYVLVFILEEAVDDLNDGKAFYDLQATGIGDYFRDCLISGNYET